MIYSSQKKHNSGTFPTRINNILYLKDTDQGYTLILT